MSVRDTFEKIKKDDIVRFNHMGVPNEYTVDSIYGTGENKEIFFGLDLECLTLVIINGKVNYQKQARGHPWGWKTNDVINKLDIIEN